MENLEKERETRKKIIFDSMGKRGQEQILKKGYDKWDPFMEPKDPIEIRKDKNKITSQEIIRAFLQQIDSDKYSSHYARAAFELCLGIINENEKYMAYYDFSCWYEKFISKQNK